MGTLQTTTASRWKLDMANELHPDRVPPHDRVLAGRIVEYFKRVVFHLCNHCGEVVLAPQSRRMNGHWECGRPCDCDDNELPTVDKCSILARRYFETAAPAVPVVPFPPPTDANNITASDVDD